ncbi:RagB/SusD family nutrient uptake outer membrane protein [Winogradskyella tangerina]|uniref:RagB/SusD family nutrient uptake outer membrane protein n=1 Tax=Winogradskyella tangerina TaxID=2023240 RepID=UPI000DBE5C87|nr:RagB/SusD family nutrient uptake outer membrane protein [Winogradskyella tangerina]
MKKIFKLKYVWVLFLFATSSCDDFVEVDPIPVTSDDFFNTPEEYEDALVGAYDLLQATFWNVLTSVVASDDIIAGGDAASIDQPTLQNVNSMNHSPADNNQLRDIWTLMYAGLNRTNFLLENENKIDFSGKEEIIAQAYFLRAYYTFELTKFYGNIPLKVENRDGVDRIVNQPVIPGDQFSMQRVESIAATYALIEQDLLEAIPNLPTSQDFAYKATRGAAQALLGKVYLYHGTFDSSKYSQAAQVLNEVINSGQYGLVTGEDFMNLFTVGGENGPESVFEIQYTNVEGAGWGCIACSEGSYFVQFNGPRSPYNDPIYASGWGFNLPTQQYYDIFDDGDMRRQTTFLDLRELQAQEDNSVYTPPREDTGFYNHKYAPRRADLGESVAQLTHPQNYRSIRYADVLLMAAEAEAQSGGTNAENYLNQVRARAYGNNDNNYTAAEGNLLDAIYEERRKELGGEGHRFFDLVRTGKAQEAFSAYNASIGEGFTPVNFQVNKNEIFPIPLIELELAQAVDRWGQNPGY